LFGEPLFVDEIVAWPNGPVVKAVYDEFSEYGDQPLVAIEKAPRLSKTAEEVIANVVLAYGQFSAWKLRDMTHTEQPYLAEAKHRGTISQGRMTDYFRAVLSRPLSRPSDMTTALRDRDYRLSLDRGLEDAAKGRRVKWGDPQPSSTST
jgi:hypothetical protein